MHITRILAIIIFCTVSSINSYIYEILQVKNLQENKTIFLFSSAENPKLEFNKQQSIQQKKDLLAFAQEKNAAVIIDDLFLTMVDENYTDEETKKFIATLDLFKKDLREELIKNNILVTFIPYISLFQETMVAKHPKKFKGTQKYVRDLEKNSEGKKKDFYSKKLEKFKKQKREFKEKMTYYSNKKNEHKKQLYFYIFLIENLGNLINLKILQTIEYYKDCKTIFIVANPNSIHKIFYFLVKKFGYEIIHNKNKTAQYIEPYPVILGYKEPQALNLAKTFNIPTNKQPYPITNLLIIMSFFIGMICYFRMKYNDCSYISIFFKIIFSIIRFIFYAVFRILLRIL